MLLLLRTFESRFVFDFGLNDLPIDVYLLYHHGSALAPPVVLLFDL
jgi:hypothetical protein